MATRVVFEPGWQRHIDGGTVGIGNDVPYAGYVQEGTRYRAAEPFLRPSLFRVRSL